MKIILSSLCARCYRGYKDKSYQGLPGDSRPNLEKHDLRNKLIDVKVLCQEVLVLDGFIQSLMIIVLTVWLVLKPSAW